jgi:ribonuclease Z
MIHYGVTATSITDVLITHFHGDHCLGFSSLVQRISLDEVPHEVRVHYPASGQRFFDRLRYASIYRDVARIAPHPIHAAGPHLTTAAWALETRALDHGVECFGYRLVEPDTWNIDAEEAARRGLRGPVLGELKHRGEVVSPTGDRIRIDDVATRRRGQKLAFIMDLFRSRSDLQS